MLISSPSINLDNEAISHQVGGGFIRPVFIAGLMNQAPTSHKQARYLSNKGQTQGLPLRLFQ